MMLQETHFVHYFGDVQNPPGFFLSKFQSSPLDGNKIKHSELNDKALFLRLMWSFGQANSGQALSD